MNSYIVDLKTVVDDRGSLTSIEGNLDIPINIMRIFYMHHIRAERGGHAHIYTDQIVIPVSGFFRVKLFDGSETREYLLDDCTKGLYIPRLTFTDLYDFSKDAVCLVLANTHYDIEQSLRNIDDFLNYIKKNI